MRSSDLFTILTTHIKANRERSISRQLMSRIRAAQPLHELLEIIIMQRAISREMLIRVSQCNKAIALIQRRFMQTTYRPLARTFKATTNTLTTGEFKRFTASIMSERDRAILTSSGFYGRKTGHSTSGKSGARATSPAGIPAGLFALKAIPATHRRGNHIDHLGMRRLMIKDAGSFFLIMNGVSFHIIPFLLKLVSPRPVTSSRKLVFGGLIVPPCLRIDRNPLFRGFSSAGAFGTKRGRSALCMQRG